METRLKLKIETKKKGKLINGKIGNDQYNRISTAKSNKIKSVARLV